MIKKLFKLFLVTLFVLQLSGCEDLFKHSGYLDEPVPGGNGIITVNNITESGFSLNWDKAEYDESSSDVLYEVYVAEGIVNSTDIISNYNPVKSAYDISSFDVTGLIEDTTYSYLIIVSGSENVLASYVNGYAKTLSPAPAYVGTWYGGDGNYTFTSDTAYFKTLLFDSVIYLKGDIESDATSLTITYSLISFDGENYIPLAGEENLSFLSEPQTKSWVINNNELTLTDEFYESITYSDQEPEETIDTDELIPGGEGIVIVNNITETGFSLSWAKAIYGGSATDVLYKVYVAEGVVNAADIVISENLKTSAYNINTFDVTGLIENTTYTYLIVVSDTANISANYDISDKSTLSPLPIYNGELKATVYLYYPYVKGKKAILSVFNYNEDNVLVEFTSYETEMGIKDSSFTTTFDNINPDLDYVVYFSLLDADDYCIESKILDETEEEFVYFSYVEPTMAYVEQLENNYPSFVNIGTKWTSQSFEYVLIQVESLIDYPAYTAELTFEFVEQPEDSILTNSDITFSYNNDIAQVEFTPDVTGTFIVEVKVDNGALMFSNTFTVGSNEIEDGGINVEIQ